MSNETSEELHHAGRKGMKWGMHIFGRQRSRTGVFGRRHKPQGNPIVKGSSRKKMRRHVDEQLREAQFIEQYRNRDRMSTRDLKNKIARLESEQKFKTLVEAPQKARLEALQKKRQARLNYIGKIASAGLDVYSKMPASFAVRNKTGKEREAAAKAFKKSQEWAKAFKDVPTTMTTFKQSGVNMGETINGVYIPSQEDLLLHYGKKGMKWKKRRGINPGEALGDLMNEANEARIRDLQRDSDTQGKNMDSNIRKIKSGVRNGKTGNPREQKYHDEYMRNAKASFETSKELSKAKNLRDRIKKARSKNMKHMAEDDTLLHYGKKGMKWKKRRGINPGEALGDLMNEANEQRIRDLERDSRAYQQNMASNISKIKSDVKKGKTKNPKEQKYLDAYNENGGKYMKTYVDSEQAKSLRDRIKKARAKRK